MATEKELTSMEKLYREKVIGDMMKHFNYKNVMQVPRMEKIVMSRGLGQAVSDKKLLEQAVEEFGLITGQKPVICESKVDVSNFKLRKGMAIGCKVTLRRNRMYEFLERFVHVATPRMRDFRGLPDKGFDGKGNYTVGIKEQIVFPEINVDRVYKIAGMDITFVTNAPTDEESYQLMAGLGFPFASTQKIAS